MGCPKNPKVFLIFAYEGPCKWKDTHITPMMTPGYFGVRQKCKLCESSRLLSFITQQNLIRDGYDSKKLARVDWRFGDHAYRLLNDEKVD